MVAWHLVNSDIHSALKWHLIVLESSYHSDLQFYIMINQLTKCFLVQYGMYCFLGSPQFFGKENKAYSPRTLGLTKDWDQGNRMLYYLLFHHCCYLDFHLEKDKKKSNRLSHCEWLEPKVLHQWELSWLKFQVIKYPEMLLWLHCWAKLQMPLTRMLPIYYVQNTGLISGVAVLWL